MQTRRANPVSPLAIVLPHPHPPMSRRTSSLLSIGSAASPRTPRSCGSPTCSSIFITPAANRKSTDSWNSSNGPDEFEWEWKPEQVLLLSRTLDALPAHLVTPFNGPIPPSNLLDKIARGVSQAKGPIEWPHSLRATRVKLIELSRLRAKEQTVAEKEAKVIIEELESALENETSSAYRGGQEKSLGITGVKRPLYRQSSMDFMNTVGTDIKNNDHLARLSSRLQRAERQTLRHPYHRSNYAARCNSPPPSGNVPSLTNPSTPSSSTLNTVSSFSSQPRVLRRTISSVSSSSLSILSSSSDGILPNPRVQHLMQDDEFAPVPPPKDLPAVRRTGAKRAPSFGALAQETRREYLSKTPVEGRHTRKTSSHCPSSDEEEKIRNVQAKKLRKQSTSCNARATPPPDSPAPATLGSSPITTRTRTSKLKTGPSVLEANLESPKLFKSKPETRCENKDSILRKENLQSLGKSSQAKFYAKPLPMRNPSVFGSELPQTHNTLLSPAPAAPPRPTHGQPPPPTMGVSKTLTSALKSAFSSSPTPASSASKPVTLNPDTGASPAPQKTKLLRKVRRLAPARRISFASLAPPGDEADADGEGDGDEKGGRIELGSAFQLH